MENKDTLKAEIASMVADIFEAKKEEDQRSRTKLALETAASNIDKLTSEVDTLKESTEVLKGEKASIEEELVSSKASYETDKKEIEEKLAESEKSAEESKSQFETVSAELEGLKAEAISAKRMEELETAGVVRDEKDAQKEKIKTMSEEEFASYRDELISVRKSILTQLDSDNKAKAEAEAAAKEKSDKEKEDGDVSKEDASKEDSNSDDSVNTQPAEISPGNAVAAALNMEVVVSNDMIKKYQNLGDAMASSMTNDK